MTNAEIEILNRFVSEVSDYPDWCGLGRVDIFSVNSYGDTLLHVAACQNRLDIIKILLKNNFPINKQGEHGYTALHEAIEQENYISALYLIKMGADLFIKNDEGDTPLDMFEI